MLLNLAYLGFKPPGDVRTHVIRRLQRLAGQWQSPLVAAIALLVGSSVPLPASHNPDFGLCGPDKTLHATGHLALTAALISTIEGRNGGSTVHAILAATFISSAYGVGTELLQERIPGRNFESGDLLAGVFGSICGVLWWYQVSRHATEA